MSDNSKFRDDLNRAKNFFEKKLKKNNFNSDSLNKEKFRDLDDEATNLSKLSARINYLKKSLKKKNEVVKSKKAPKKLKTIKKVEVKPYEPSKKNKDVNGKSIRNYFSDKSDLSPEKYVMLCDFEINGKLFIAGNINKMPSDIIKKLLSDNIIKSKIDSYNKISQTQNSFYVKKTFGLSEVKRSKLRNKKNFNKM